MTSNAGAEALSAQFEAARDANEPVESAAASGTLQAIANDALRAFLRPEFINRVDEVVVFHPLEKEHTRRIVALQLGRLKARLHDAGIQLKATQEALDWLAHEGHDPAFGARPVKRLIERAVLNPLSKALLADELRRDTPSVMDVFDDGLVFRQPLEDETLIPLS